LGFQEHLYTSIHSGDEFERWIESEFEGPGQEAIARVVAGERLSPEDWRALARFAAAQDVRTPARYVENVQRWNRDLGPLVEKVVTEAVAEYQAAKKEGRQPLCNKTGTERFGADLPFRVSIQPDPERKGAIVGAETVIGRQMWVASMRLLLTTSVRELYKHRWSLVLAPHGVSWLTSDDPVLRLNYNSDRDYDFGGGWGSPTSEIIFPISPQHLLYTKIGRRSEPRIHPSHELAGRLQRLLAARAHRWIYATEPVERIQELRARKVDRAQFEAESRQQEEWHKTHSAAETALSRSQEPAA
jgi:hypothetical protein